MKNQLMFMIGYLTLVVSCTSPLHSEGDCKNEVKQIENLPPNINGRQWDKTNIVVCWDDTNLLDENEREYLQQIVKDGWEQYVEINFIGWGLCSLMVNPDVMISNEQEEMKLGEMTAQGVTDVIGMPRPENFPDHVKINFGSCRDPLTKNICYQRIILHEFGHVLNLVHEQTRPDTPDWCRQYVKDNGEAEQSKQDNKQTLIGPWDNDSIMNYCNNTVNRPSCWDIANVEYFYGSR